MTDMPQGYYDRFDPDKNYERQLFRAGYVLQSAEMNELQSASDHRFRTMGDAIFRDGDIVRDAAVVLNADGTATCESGAIYIRGAVRGVPEADLDVPDTGTIAIGVYLIESVVGPEDDEDLRDPASELRNYNEPGASRLKVEPRWGLETDEVDGEFFPIYTVTDGFLSAREAPPAFDAVTRAIARYDRDSTQSNYVVSGMRVKQLADQDSGEQVYNIDEGRARVNGYGVELSTSRRVVFNATPVTRYIDSEPKTADGGTERVDLDRTPVGSISQVRITTETTSTINHGNFTGASDPIPDPSVVEIVSVEQGATTYVAGDDYTLSGGEVDWSADGAEPAPGSSYDVTYRHIVTVTPQDEDLTGYTVSDAVPGTLILTNYNVMLPRIDRLCINEAGMPTWVIGTSTDYNPVRPTVPGNLLPLAQISQTWDGDRRISNDGVRTVPMASIEAMNERIDQVIELVAQQKLLGDISTRETSAKKGLFVDPFLDDRHRDAGISQSAAIIDGVLTLPVDGEPQSPDEDVGSPQACAYDVVPFLVQEFRTGEMRINPYMSFGVLPAQVELSPSIDRWVELETNFTGPQTRFFYEGAGSILVNETLTSNIRLINTAVDLIQNLRQIEISFTLSGWGPEEELSTVTFDGLDVEPEEI